MYWFDIWTGKLLGEKPLSSEYRDYTLIHYNHTLNQFIKMQTRDHNSECNEYSDHLEHFELYESSEYCEFSKYSEKELREEPKWTKGCESEPAWGGLSR